jgi:hypothetical protein
MRKYVRITVTALGLTTCVLLIALWKRSYSWLDSLLVRLSPTRVAMAGSINGGLLLHFPVNDFSANWKQRSRPLTGPGISRSPFRFGSEFRSIDGGVQIPHWSVVLSAGLIAIIPWLPWSFSLRTLLVATTLVAVVLGIVAVWR